MILLLVDFLRAYMVNGNEHVKGDSTDGKRKNSR